MEKQDEGFLSWSSYDRQKRCNLS
jgi:hypothetical protein